MTRAESAAGVNKMTARESKAMKAKDRCTVVACCRSRYRWPSPTRRKTPSFSVTFASHLAPTTPSRVPGSILQSASGGLTRSSSPLSRRRLGKRWLSCGASAQAIASRTTTRKWSSSSCPPTSRPSFNLWTWESCLPSSASTRRRW